MRRRFGSVGKWTGFMFLLMVIGSCSSPADKNPSGVTTEKKPVSEVYTVEITQMKFFPAELTVKKGDRIVFVNRDIVTHDVTEEKTKAWTSSPLQTEQTWLMVAEKSANYFCSIHPVMKGRIIVQ